MEQLLVEKLRTYITYHNPDLLIKLQSPNSFQGYLAKRVKEIQPLMHRLLHDGLPMHVIEELCLVEMTASLRPSKFKYIRKLLKDKFYEDYNRMKETGSLTYEIIQLMDWCEDGFACFEFNEDNEDDSLLKEVIRQGIQHYLEIK
ncbi:MAG TPA: hypothetical protein VFQ86_02710 [Arachidicoccus soli]|uniref:Uncharacterized protein n=1 Tax=Arachidicoccus soli TaxID=2341117 RepID=A0A386HP14_9BACT|nr:hypothetical protein [Arachidicoccus soli]AYD47422.1 hypothetical protein D6B99_07240 [Arachidicoccus soli]HEU0226623.1 hypothetical protein [Arachidicoccus soli]